jgi:hypothetical protein
MDKNELSQDIGTAVAASYCKSQNTTFDPILAIMLASLIVSLVRLAYDCYKDRNKAMKCMQNPSLLARIMLSLEIKKCCAKNKIKLNQKQLKDALLNYKLSEEELSILFSGETK